MTWRIGISTGCCTDRPISEALIAVQEAGLGEVELGTPPHHFDPWQHAQVILVRDQLRRDGITPISIHAPFGGLLELSDPNPHHRHAAVGGVLTAASALAEIGGSIVVVHASDVPRDGHQVEERLAHCAAALTVLNRAVQELGLRLAVETPLPHLIGGDPDEFAWIMARVDAGVCLDTGHLSLGHHWQRFTQLVGSRLIHVHASDNHGHFDDHLAPGDGTIDWNEIGQDLRTLDYQGSIMLELKCPTGSLAGHFARASARARAVLGMERAQIHREHPMDGAP